MGHTTLFLDFSKTKNRLINPICPEPAIGANHRLLEHVFLHSLVEGLEKVTGSVLIHFSFLVNTYW